MSSSDKVKRTLKALLKQEDNRYCADCPQKKPTWASINLGVFLCLHCAGIHRDMGVHISKVRSVELDTWKEDWVGVMKKWGNKRANKYWEAKLPENFDGRPSEAEAQALSNKLKSFIRGKYERKRWAASSVNIAFNETSNDESTVTVGPKSVPQRRPSKPKRATEVQKKKLIEEEEEDLFKLLEEKKDFTYTKSVTVQKQLSENLDCQLKSSESSSHSSKKANIMAMFQKPATNHVSNGTYGHQGQNTANILHFTQNQHKLRNHNENVNMEARFHTSYVEQTLQNGSSGQYQQQRQTVMVQKQTNLKDANHSHTLQQNAYVHINQQRRPGKASQNGVVASLGVMSSCSDQSDSRKSTSSAAYVNSNNNNFVFSMTQGEESSANKSLSSNDDPFAALF